MNNIVENITTQVNQIEKKDDELRMIMGVKELDEDITKCWYWWFYIRISTK